MTWCTYTSNSPPCVILSHPIDRNILLVGTYTLVDGKESNRWGSLDLYKYDGSAIKLLDFAKTENSSILDLKFFPNDSYRIISAQSNGSLIIWKIDRQKVKDIEDKNENDNYSWHIKKIKEIQFFDKDVLVTSISFFNNDDNKIFCSLTSGEVTLCDLKSEIIISSNLAHSLESWTIIGNPWSYSTAFSGGDDSALVLTDFRAPSFDSNAIDYKNDVHEASTVWKNSRIHNAGVTSILPCKFESYLENINGDGVLITGGYDDIIRFIDIRGAPKIECLSSKNLDGGVWRLIPKPNGFNYRNGKSKENEKEVDLLTCCMYAGAKITSGNLENFDFKVKSEFTEGHNSMVYGADWISENTLASVSFYDKKVCVWSI